ncbi:MAG: hypothetical protein AAF206_26475 [Bacteroidota bacterium]
MKIKAFYLLGLVFVLGLQGLSAQVLTLSPYSRYGIGDIFNNTTVRNASMGGVGVATDNYFSVNRINPASFADLVFTTLDASTFGQGSRFRNNDATENQITAGLRALNFAFPSNGGPSFVMGFSPYSTVGYEIQDFSDIELENDSLIQERRFQASGGLNQAYIGLGFKTLNRRLSIGGAFQFSFGSINYDWANLIRNQDSSLNSNFQAITATEERFVRGSSGQFGLIYQDTLNKTKNVLIRLGATADLAIDFSEDSRGEFSNTTITDTLKSRTFDRRDISLPAKFGLGFSISRPGYYTFSADATYQDWTDFEDNSSSIVLGQELRVATGVEWTPKYDGFKYFGRVNYRFGAFYKQSYIANFGDNAINDFGVTFGIGLPASRQGNSRLNQGRSTSRVNLGVILGRRGDLNNGQPLEELYARIILGVSLNDRWFIRRVVD